MGRLGLRLALWTDVEDANVAFLGCCTPDHVPVRALHRGRPDDAMGYLQDENLRVPVASAKAPLDANENVVDGPQQGSVRGIVLQIVQRAIGFWREDELVGRFCHNAKLPHNPLDDITPPW